MSEAKRQGPAVSGNQVLSAGFAAAVAAFVTSRFGVAGTLLGAALTAMIITAGSAILKAYIESVTGNVRKVPRKVRERRNLWTAGRTAEPDTMPERPDLRNNFAGRMRAALDWFSHLPPLTRRSILVKGLIGAAIAFVIGMGVVWVVEKGIDNSLSCGLWGKCPAGASPGINTFDSETGANPSIRLGGAKANAAPGDEARDPALRQNPAQQAPSDRQRNPDQQRPSPPGEEPGRGIFAPDRPVEPKGPDQPETPSTASPAPDEQPPREQPPREQPPRGGGGGGSAPPQKDPPASASPAPSE